MMVINKDLSLDDNEDGRDALGPDLRSGQLAQGLVGNVCQQLAADLPRLLLLSAISRSNVYFNSTYIHIHRPFVY